MTTSDIAPLTEQQAADLDVARALAAAGVPVFVATPDPTSATGFSLPTSWQQTAPDPAVVDQWRPGMALCAVMGHGLDLIDVDPRNGGDAAMMNGSTPTSYATALTPSGGVHSFIRSLGTGSRDNVFPGIDVKSGMPDGSGRGFAFLAPTVRLSKVTGEPGQYRWAQTPDLDRLTTQGPQDGSGATLAAHILELKADSGVSKVGGPDFWREFLLSREPQSAPAAERAIREKLEEVATWTAQGGAGFRQTLLRAALTLGGYVGGGYLDEDDARDKLIEATSQVWGPADADDMLWIAQGLADGQNQPFYVYTAADELAYNEVAQATAQASGAAGEPPWNVYHAVGTEPFDPTGDGTDQGLAEAVAQRMYPALRYGVDSGTWLVRGRQVWAEREDMSSWAVSAVARLMPLGSTPVPKEVEDRTDAHWQAVRRAKFMDSAGSGKVERKLRSIVRNSDHPAGVEVGELDMDPEILWAGGVPWNLRESLEVPTIAAIDPATPHLRTALVAPELRPTPFWDQFIATVWPNPELRAWAMRVLSISLAGYPDAALPILYGPERTGKTQVVTLICDALGTYAHAADPRLLGGADNAHASVIYALKGRRLSFIDEGPRRGHLAAERLKQLTGGGSLTGNAMRANPITFKPTHTLAMTTNDEPPLTDPALRARARVIPSEGDQAAVRAARRALTAPIWADEAPGVLAKLMSECAAWLADQDTASNAAAPAFVRGVVDEMAAGQDPVRDWVEMCTVPSEPGTAGRELYRRFRDWFDMQAIYRRATPPTETAFGRSLTGMGYLVRPNQGPKRNQNFRPLSVMNGPGVPAPWESGGAGGVSAVPTVAPMVPGGSGAQPSGSNNPRSAPVSSSSSDSSDSSYRPIDNNITTSPIRSNPLQEIQGNRSDTTDCRAPAAPNSASPATMPVSGGLARPSEPRAEAAVAEGRPDHASLSPTVANWENRRARLEDSGHAAKPKPVTNSDVAALAYQGQATKQIPKAEARAQLKEAQRYAAVREASGEVLALPAAVDRAGNTVPLTLEQADAVVRTALTRSGALTVDVETSGYPVGHPDYALRSVQLGDADAAVVLHPVDHAELVRALLADAPKLHAHSATADLVPLAHAGLLDAEAGWERMHDTVIPAKLADPASTGSDPGLKQLAGAVLGEHSVAPAAEGARKAVFKAGKWLENTKTDTPIERSGWAQIETGSVAMLRYAASDVLDTAALARALPLPAPAVYERERLAQRMTARVAHRGVRIDGDHVRALTETHTAARAEVGARVQAFGISNPGSPVQVGQALVALGASLPISEKSGRPSVAESALEPLKGAEGEIGALATAVLDYRHHDTVLGTFLEPYRLLCESGDGRARPTVYTLGTDTGRMSCVRPNLQQLPRSGGVRACITADPGQLMIGADFSGVEIRVAAALSQDPTLLQFLRDGRDLHAEIAKMVWGESAGKAGRYKAKPMVFGRIYGGRAPTLAQQGKVSLDEAEAVIGSLDALTPQLSAWSAQISAAARAGHTQFKTYSGRIIHLPRERPHAAPNYGIQGTARELLVDALLKWADTPWGQAVLLPVHDELDAFVPEDEAEEAAAALVRCMETELFGVQIIAEPSTPNFFWADST